MNIKYENINQEIYDEIIPESYFKTSNEKFKYSTFLEYIIDKNITIEEIKPSLFKEIKKELNIDIPMNF